MKKIRKVPKLPTDSKQTPSSRAATRPEESSSKWIRTETRFPLPAHVKDALARLDDAGFIAYVVGGSVRDFLLKRPTKDHDIATNATPDEIDALFPGSIEVGKQFGVVKVPIEGEKYPLEIATFRKDLEYHDHRHPDGIEFSGPSEDAARRDFTINALYYDPKSQRILDSVGGITDLRARVLRAIGDPSLRFKEDALRLIRAIRFATALDFEVDLQTLTAIQTRAKLVSKVSAERLYEEMTQILTGPAPGRAIKLLSELGILALILPEVEALKEIPSLFVRTLRGMDELAAHCPVRTPELAWSALILDVGKPVVAGKSKTPERRARGIYLGHEREGSLLAGQICARFRMSRDSIDTIVRFVDEHLKFREVYRMREATLQRFIRSARFDEMLELHRAEAVVYDGNLGFYEFARSRFEDVLRQGGATPGRILSGEDLIQLGLSPGRKFSEILREVEDLVLEGRIVDKEQALEYVVQKFVN